jgi:hypothetical protein
MAVATISRLRAGAGLPRRGIWAKIARRGRMREYLRVTRPYLVLLAVFTVGRLALGFRGVPYERGHFVFSIVILSVLSSIFYGGFCRKWRGFTMAQALAVGATIGVASQGVILVLTALSYALHVDTYFVNPRALNAEGHVSFGAAMASRLAGFLFNTVSQAIAAGVGWVAGAALPEARTAD